jgi:hypothetical protein
MAKATDRGATGERNVGLGKGGMLFRERTLDAGNRLGLVKSFGME